jgi:hypothetical protein
MANEILSNLAKSDSFWHQTVCHAGKPMICPYVQFLCVQNILCYGIPGNAFIDYFQMSKTTSRRCLSCLMRGIVCCSALAAVYLRNLQSPMLEILSHINKWLPTIDSLQSHSSHHIHYKFMSGHVFVTSCTN